MASTPDAVVMYDMQGRTLYVNESFVKTFGWTMEELSGKGVPYLPDSERDLSADYIKRILSEGHVANAVDTKRYTKDGRTLDVSVSASRFHDHKGNPAGMVVILRDISDRKLAESASQDSEASYRGIFDSMNDAIFVHDIETGQIIDVNRKMLEMYGYTLDEARGISVGELSSGEPPYSQEDALRWIRKAAEDEAQLFEWLCKDKSGRLFWVEVNLKRAVIGGHDCLLAVVRDISERKSAEEVLRSSEELQRTILATSPVGIGLTKDRTMVWANDAWARIFGFAKDDESYLHSSVRQLYPTQEEFERTGAILYRGLDKGHVNEADASMIRQDGTVFDAHITIKAVDPSDLNKGAIATITDITPRKRAEQALRKSEQRLDLALRGADLGLWDWNLKIGSAVWNERAIEMLGYARDEVEPSFRFWKGLVHPEDWPKVAEILNGHIEGRLPFFDAEYRIRGKSDEWIWVSGPRQRRGKGFGGEGLADDRNDPRYYRAQTGGTRKGKPQESAPSSPEDAGNWDANRRHRS